MSKKCQPATNSELLGVPLKQQAAVVPAVSVCLFEIRQVSKRPRCVQNKKQNGTFLSKEIRKKFKQIHANSCLLSPTGVGYLLRSVLKPQENTRKKSVHAICPPEWDLLRSVLTQKFKPNQKKNRPQNILGSQSSLGTLNHCFCKKFSVKGSFTPYNFFEACMFRAVTS